MLYCDYKKCNATFLVHKTAGLVFNKRGGFYAYTHRYVGYKSSALLTVCRADSTLLKISWLG